MIEIKDSVCGKCSEINGWYNIVVSKIEEEYPGSTGRVGLNDYITMLPSPANSPQIALWVKLWKAYEVKCLTFEYDDNYEGLCRYHAEELMKGFDD